MKFRAILGGHDISGEAVNPGEWFGKAWIVEVGCGFSSAFYAVEADSDSEAIDALCDHDEHGKSIRMDADDERFDDEDTHRAGNAGEPVDLDDVHIHGTAAHDHRMHPTSVPFTSVKGNSGLVYVLDNGSEVGPIAYAAYEDGKPPLKDFSDYSDMIEYRNERESGFGGNEGDWFYGDAETLTIYTGTFANDHSPGASAYTYHDTYDTREDYDARLAELEAMPEYLDDDADDDDDSETLHCDSCNMLAINGVACHETGCPDAWKDRDVACFECGCDFRPDERGQRTCPDCLNPPEDTNYQVVVGNIGTVYDGPDREQADRDFDDYVELSQSDPSHRCYGEDVRLLSGSAHGQDIDREHVGHIADDSEPSDD